jgi:hypothetical protein
MSAMELFVKDTSDQNKEQFLLRTPDQGIVEQVRQTDGSVVNTWKLPTDIAKLETQSDGTSIRVGFKRFVINPETSLEKIKEWFETYSSGQSVFSTTQQESELEIALSRLSSLLNKGHITEGEHRKLVEDLERSNRLSSLRDEGLLNDDELKVLGVENRKLATPQNTIAIPQQPAISPTWQPRLTARPYKASTSQSVMVAIGGFGLFGYMIHVFGEWISLGTDQDTHYFLDMSRFGNIYKGLKQSGDMSWDLRGEYLVWGAYVVLALVVIAVLLSLTVTYSSVVSDQSIFVAKSLATLISVSVFIDLFATLWAYKPNSNDPSLSLNVFAWMGFPSLVLVASGLITSYVGRNR